jgi:hypothetical protein
MKKFYVFLLFSLLSVSCFALPYTGQSILKKEHVYVTVFRFQNIATEKNQGYVVREENQSGYFYQVYNAEDQLLGSAEYPNASSDASTAKLELYDFNGQRVGMIQGECCTTQLDRFRITTDTFNGHAYLSRDEGREFSIVDEVNQVMIKLCCTSNIVLNNNRNSPNIIKKIEMGWEIQTLKNNQLPEFVIKVFTAFIIDKYEEQFYEELWKIFNEI